MPRAKPRAVLVRDSFAAPEPAIPQLLQTESTATGDLQTPTRILDSFWFILPGELQESFLRLANIVKGEFVRFNQVGHDGSASAAVLPTAMLMVGNFRRNVRFALGTTSRVLHYQCRFVSGITRNQEINDGKSTESQPREAGTR